MADPSRYANSAAIVLGFFGLALVVRAGLTRIADAVAARPAPSITLPTGAAPLTPPAPEPVDPAVMERDWELKNQEQARSALNEQRPTYAKACFRAKDPGGVLHVPFSANVSLVFDADGNETARDVAPTPGTPPTFAECVRSLKQPSLKIPPPGKVVRTTVALTVP